jgi:hypothetical protein
MLAEVKKNATITGIEPGQVVRVVTTEPVGDNALAVYYKTSDGRLLERMLFRTDEATLALDEAGRPWAFDAAGAAFKLAAEAYRITLAHLFDPMMAVHTSNVEPLPHPDHAVYEPMLPRQPLRDRPRLSEGRFFGQVKPRDGAERQGSGCRVRQQPLAQHAGAQARRPSQRFVPFSASLQVPPGHPAGSSGSRSAMSRKIIVIRKIFQCCHVF